MENSKFLINDFYLDGIISKRTRNCLLQANIKNISQLMNLNELEIDSLPRIGVKSKGEITYLLEVSKSLNKESKIIATEEIKSKFAEQILKLRNFSLMELNFSTRTRNCLVKNDINSLYDLISLNLSDIKRIEDFGAVSLKEIKNFLKKNNLSLGYNIDQIESKANKFSYKSDFPQEILNFDLKYVPSKPKLSEKHKNITDSWNSGNFTLEDLGKKYGLTRERIRQILTSSKRKGFEVLNPQEVSILRKENNFQKLYQSLKKVYIDLYNEDLSPSQISKKLSLSSYLSNDIEKRLIKEGLIQKIYFRKSKVGLSDEERRLRWIKIRNFRKENKTLDEIAMLMNLSKPSIANTIRDMKDAGWEVPNSRDDDQYITVRLSSEEFELRKAYILEGTLNGKSRKQLGEELGLDAGMISRFIAKHLQDYL